jgi:hypothetical protein
VAGDRDRLAVPERVAVAGLDALAAEERPVRRVLVDEPPARRETWAEMICRLFWAWLPIVTSGPTSWCSAVPPSSFRRTSSVSVRAPPASSPPKTPLRKSNTAWLSSGERKKPGNPRLSAFQTSTASRGIRSRSFGSKGRTFFGRGIGAFAPGMPRARAKVRGGACCGAAACTVGGRPRLGEGRRSDPPGGGYGPAEPRAGAPPGP